MDVSNIDKHRLIPCLLIINFYLKVTLSHNKPALQFSLPPQIQQAAPVVKVLEDGSLLFQDGSVAQAQVLLLCTGYSFHFPFLCPEQLGLEVDHHLVAPLYKYLLPPAFPSLFFIGICKIICPFPHFHCQVSIQGSCLFDDRCKLGVSTQTVGIDVRGATPIL